MGSIPYDQHAPISNHMNWLTARESFKCGPHLFLDAYVQFNPFIDPATGRLDGWNIMLDRELIR